MQEIGEFFRRDDKTIRRWIFEERFPNATKIVDGWLIPEEDIQSLYDAGKNQQTVGVKTKQRRIISPGI